MVACRDVQDAEGYEDLCRQIRNTEAHLDIALINEICGTTWTSLMKTLWVRDKDASDSDIQIREPVLEIFGRNMPLYENDVFVGLADEIKHDYPNYGYARIEKTCGFGHQRIGGMSKHKNPKVTSRDLASIHLLREALHQGKYPVGDRIAYDKDALRGYLDHLRAVFPGLTYKAISQICGIPHQRMRDYLYNSLNLSMKVAHAKALFGIFEKIENGDSSVGVSPF